MSMSITKNIGIATAFLAALVLLFMAFASAANAQTYYYPSQNIQSLQQYINYLQDMITQLEQLKAQQQRYGYGYQYRYEYNPYNPYGQVRGISYSDGDVEAETIGVGNTRGDSTTFYGEVDLNGASYAYVWFEYGTDDDLDEDTRKVRVDRYNGYRFSVRLTNLDEDERYVFRAVAEGPDGDRDYGEKKYFRLEGYHGGHYSNNDEPEAYTDDAEDVEEDEARLRGEVDMNDFNNGYVFFVYGEDENAVEDVEDEDKYRDIDEDGDDLQKVVVDSDLDNERSYWRRVVALDDNTDHYFRICVEYEDEDNDETLECGKVEHFETD